MDAIKKNKALAIIFWLLSLAVAVIIFMFSSATGEESAEVSEGLLARLIAWLSASIDHNLLRKIAHFLEFTALGFCVGGAFHFTFGKTKIYLPLAVSALYAVSDEIHQYFVPERACRLTDILIDSAGSLTGILIIVVLLTVIGKSITKRRKSK